MNIFKKLRKKLKPKNRYFKALMLIVVLAVIATSLFVVYGQSLGTSGGGPSLTKGLVAHWTLDAEDYEEGTENLAPNTDYSNKTFNQTYTSSCWGGDSATIEYFDSGGYNNLPYKKLTKTNSGTGGCYLDEYYGINIENNKTYVISAYVKASRNISSVPAYVIGLNRRVDNAYRNGPSLNLTTEWQRFSWVYNAGADHAGIYQNRGIVYEDNDLPLEVYWAGFQVEEKSYATPFVSGTRTDRVVDKTPYSNHGTNYGATPTTDRHGKEGGAMSFDGVNDYIQFSEDTTTESFSLWIDFTNITTVSYFFGSQTVSGRGVRYNGSTLLLYGSIGTQAITYDFEDGYVHLVGVKNNNDWNVYNNGEYIGTFTGVGSLGIGYIGRRNDGYYFNGKIDDVRIYNRALSEEEISLLYGSYEPKTQISSINSGLIGHWTLSEWDHDNNRIIDKTPYENHGTNYGASFTKDRHEKEGGAMSFNASGNKISIEKPVGKSGFLTASVWYKRDDSFSSGSWRTIIGHKTGNIHHLISQSTNRNLGIWDGGFRDFGHTPKDKEWEHYVVIYNSGIDATLYVDGQYKSKVNTSLNLLTNPIGMIGNWNSNSYWGGSIDDVRIYDRALSEGEISLLYNSYSPQSGGDSLQKGLVLDMPLSSEYTKTETAGSQIMTDKTPYGNDGQNYGATISSDGASFDGASNFYVLTNNTLVLDSSQTYSAWIKPNSIVDGLSGVLTTHAHAITSNIGINKITNKFNVSIGYTDGTREYSNKSSVYTIVPNEWQHVVLIYNHLNNSVTFYINGNFDKTWNLTKTVKFTEQKALVGMWSNNYYGAYRFNGKISNVKIYNRTLSPEEVESLYTQGAASLGGIPNE